MSNQYSEYNSRGRGGPGWKEKPAKNLSPVYLALPSPITSLSQTTNPNKVGYDGYVPHYGPTAERGQSTTQIALLLAGGTAAATLGLAACAPIVAQAPNGYGDLLKTPTSAPVLPPATGTASAMETRTVGNLRARGGDFAVGMVQQAVELYPDWLGGKAPHVSALVPMGRSGRSDWLPVSFLTDGHNFHFAFVAGPGDNPDQALILRGQDLTAGGRSSLSVLTAQLNGNELRWIGKDGQLRMVMQGVLNDQGVLTPEGTVTGRIIVVDHVDGREVWRVIKPLKSDSFAVIAAEISDGKLQSERSVSPVRFKIAPSTPTPAAPPPTDTPTPTATALATATNTPPPPTAPATLTRIATAASSPTLVEQLLGKDPEIEGVIKGWGTLPPDKIINLVAVSDYNTGAKTVTHAVLRGARRDANGQVLHHFQFMLNDKLYDFEAKVTSNFAISGHGRPDNSVLIIGTVLSISIPNDQYSQLMNGKINTLTFQGGLVRDIRAFSPNEFVTIPIPGTPIP